MGGKLKWYLLAVIFAVVLGARLFSDDSFFHFRQAEHISKTGLPLTNDLLSAGGKTIIQSPLFDYVLAIGFALPHSLKILPNILAALLVIPVFLIVLWLTKNTPISLLFAFLSGFVPIFFTKTFNHLTPLALSLPLIFFTVYAFLRVPKKSWTITYLLFLFSDLLYIL
jgi:asparagine N-glycosylation enzyme membrane subunit Stt3